jgi:GH25 family lysozyme M1 (1,4-beta-N-acetylmuramidase)
MTRALAALGEVSVASSGPFFIPDVYSHDLGDAPNFSALAAQPRIVGCIIKATQGVSYAPAWFTNNWPRVRAAGGSRYGTSWFRGCYHYATPDASGTAQADFVVAALERAGGWNDNDIPPAWDFEDGAAKIWTGRGISKQQVIDTSSQFAERIKSRLGCTPILYTGATWRQYGITSSAGFSQMWSSHLDKMAPFGWPNTRYAMWQYAGDGKYYNPATAVRGYPLSVPGWGATDMNVVMSGGVAATSIEQVRRSLTGSGGLLVPLLVLGGLLALGVMLARHRSGERVF